MKLPQRRQTIRKTGWSITPNDAQEMRMLFSDVFFEQGKLLVVYNIKGGGGIYNSKCQRSERQRKLCQCFAHVLSIGFHSATTAACVLFSMRKTDNSWISSASNSCLPDGRTLLLMIIAFHPKSGSGIVSFWTCFDWMKRESFEQNGWKKVPLYSNDLKMTLDFWRSFFLI